MRENIGGGAAPLGRSVEPAHKEARAVAQLQGESGFLRIQEGVVVQGQEVMYGACKLKLSGGNERYARSKLHARRGRERGILTQLELPEEATCICGGGKLTEQGPVPPCAERCGCQSLWHP